MKLKNFVFFLILPLLISCTETIKNNAIITNSNFEDENLSENKKEFYYAYDFLNYLYLFAHSDSLVPAGTSWYRQLRSTDYYIDEGYSNVSLNTTVPSEIMDTYYMFTTLNDKYTNYIPPQFMNFDDFMTDFNEREHICNTGLNVYPVKTGDSSVLVVMQVNTGSAADLLGMQIGDTIVSVTGIETNNKILFDKLTSGKEKSIVEITIARNINGERVIKDYTIPLIDYIPPSVTFMVIDSIAIINILEFSVDYTPSDRGTYGEFLEALEKTSYTKATIIDLRGNPGGDVVQCDSITREMLHKNDTIGFVAQANIDTTTDMPIVQNELQYVDIEGIASNRYFVFLADSNSASCAEYTIMGVTTTKKSPIIGMTTHGKGVSYLIIPSYLYGAMMMTNAMILDKERNSYHMYGIEPDIILDDYDKMLDTALAIAKEGTMKRTHSYGSNIRKVFTQSLRKSSYELSKPSKKDLGMYKIIKQPLQKRVR